MSGRLVAIVGPTGVGKSAEALRLASQYNGEIVSADSRQVYRHMDIGTAKPSIAEQRQAAHHLIDIREPDQPFSLGEYQTLAFQAIDNIFVRGRLPIIVGGTGQYVWAVLNNWSIPRVPPDLAYRLQLEKKAEQGQAADLYAELQLANPAAADRIDARNVRRVIRALEIGSRGNSPGKQPAPFESLIIGLTAPRTELYRRIDERIKIMMQAGLIDEVEKLLARGYSQELPSLSGIGYRHMIRYLKGELTLSSAIESMNIDSHRLVRQQYNWFKPVDPRIRWIDTTCDFHRTVSRLMTDFLGAGSC